MSSYQASLSHLTESGLNFIQDLKDQINALSRQILETEKHLQAIGSTESAMQSAESQIATALQMMLTVCPDELENYQQVIDNLFQAAKAKRDGIKELESFDIDVDDVDDNLETISEVSDDSQIKMASQEMERGNRTETEVVDSVCEVIDKSEQEQNQQQTAVLDCADSSDYAILTRPQLFKIAKGRIEKYVQMSTKDLITQLLSLNLSKSEVQTAISS